jgi:acyl-CoA hydrolase
MKTLCILVSVLVLTTFSAAIAQQPVQPPPQTAGNRPSLAVTMQFLQARLNEQGKMSWTTHYHDSADNTNWTYQFIFEAGKVVADASACTIAYHYIIVRDGVKISDSDASFNLHDVQDITMITGDQRQNNNDTAAGHPTWNAKVDPPVIDLIVRAKEKTEFYFFFFDGDTANRVTKALGHAVELCGGSRGSF